MEGRREKTGGRKAGVQNKVTGAIREELKKFIDNQRPEFERAFKKLSPKEKCRAYIRLLPYVTPSYQSISMDLNSMSTEDLIQFEEYLKTKYAVQNANTETGDNQED